MDMVRGWEREFIIAVASERLVKSVIFLCSDFHLIRLLAIPDQNVTTKRIVAVKFNKFTK